MDDPFKDRCITRWYYQGVVGNRNWVLVGGSSHCPLCWEDGLFSPTLLFLWLLTSSPLPPFPKILRLAQVQEYCRQPAWTDTPVRQDKINYPSRRSAFLRIVSQCHNHTNCILCRQRLGQTLPVVYCFYSHTHSPLPLLEEPEPSFYSR